MEKKQSKPTKQGKQTKATTTKKKGKTNKKKSEKPFSLKREILSWIFTIVLAVGIGMFISKGIIVNMYIPSESMERTIMTGDKLIALRTSYWFNDPERGDIVVFHYPDNEEELYIKRIIGKEGDKIEGKKGVVYRNGEPLDEPYINEPAEDNFGPFEVPKDSYFMLGDNRNYSLDSRYWENTYVKKDKIIGKAFFRYYPKFKKVH